jgi:hypothetical protein
MARTVGLHPNIKEWEAERLINDLAVGEKTYPELAEEYGVVEQSVYQFRSRHRAAIHAKKQDLSSEFGHIWATQKGNRLRGLTDRLEEVVHQIELIHEHAQRETELIRTVDPDAAEVRCNSRELLAYDKEYRALAREIADQCGQLPQRVSLETTVTRNPITDFDTIAIDDDGTFYAVKQ